MESMWCHKGGTTNTSNSNYFIQFSCRLQMPELCPVYADNPWQLNKKIKKSTKLHECDIYAIIIKIITTTRKCQLPRLDLVAEQ